MEADKYISEDRLQTVQNTPIFPVIHSTLLASELINEVTRDYGVRMPNGCRLLRAKLNDTYLITTNTERYIYRIYRSRWRSLPEIAYELELLMHLRKKGVPVATPIPRRDGSLVGAIRAPEGIRYTVLFSHAPGRPFYGTHIAQHAELFGRALALLHRSCDDFYYFHTRSPLDLAFLVEKPLQAIQPLLTHRSHDWEYIQNVAERLQRSIKALESSNLNWGVCHGDPISANAHISSEQIITFFDFDFCAPGWRAYDISGMWGIARYNNNPEAWLNFLRGYRSVHPLSETDIQAAPLFDAIGNIWSEGLHATFGNEWGFEWLDDEHFDRMVHNLKSWEEFYVRHRP